MAVIRLKIGDYTFQLSPRDEMDFDFGRAIAKLQTMGNPQYQDVGVDEKKITFSGAFIGTDAWQQAEQLEQIMDQGNAVTLVYGPLHRTVRIENFNPKVKRFDYVLYDFTLVVIPTSSGFQIPSQQTSTTTTAGQAKTIPPVSSTSTIQQYADKSVVVQQGQTLWSISQAEYGRGDLWPILAKVNGIKDEHSLSNGQKLLIPSKANIQKALDAYNNRINTVITTAGIAYLESLEAKAT